MIISRKEILEAAENGTPILNHLDELAEDAMKAIFFERVPICEGSIGTKPLISPSKERVLTKNLGRNEYVIYKGTCSRCGETVEFKLTRTDIVTHSFPFYRGISEFGSRHRKARPLYHETSGLTDFIEHGPYSSHELLVTKEGVKILCGACYNELIGEIEEASRDFLSGDVLGWANDCNNGLIPQEDIWKKEFFTLWKVHKETHKVVELKIDDLYYWLDEDFKNEVNETYGSTYTKERQYWREEDIPKRNDKESDFHFHGQIEPLRAECDTLLIEDSTGAYISPIMDIDGSCWQEDETFGQALAEPTDRTREYIKKVCLPCDPSLIVFTKEMMQYVLKAEGVDEDAVMRHNSFLPYDDYLKTPYWYYVSGRVKWAAKQRCSRCGRPLDLQVHHLTYEHRGIESKYPEDLICLCKRCHAKVHEQDHKQIGDFISEFQNILE